MSSIKTSKIVPLSSTLTIDSTTTVVVGKLSAGGTAGDTPLAPLQVYGATTVQGAANRGVFLASNATNSRQVQIGINDSSQLGWIAGWASASGGGLTFCINPTGANVGIGTASPAVALDVSGEARSSTSTTSESNAKTLTTKDYVDDLQRIGSTIVVNGVGSSLQYTPSGWSITFNGTTTVSVTAPVGTWYGVILFESATSQYLPIGVTATTTLSSYVTSLTNRTTGTKWTLILTRVS